jgi:protein TonB
MPRDERIFSDLTRPSSRVGSRQGTSVLATVILEALLLAILAAVPLLAVDALPAPAVAMAAFVTAPAPPPAPPPPRRAADRQPSPQPDVTAAPTEAPDAIAPEPPAIDAGPELPGLPTGVGASVPDGVVGSAGAAIDGLRPPPPPPARTPEPVGGRISAPRKTKHVAPRYPPIAQAAGVEAIVIIEAVIDERGRVSDARVLRGHPLLDGEALAAVRQWAFTPTLLNDAPTPVIMTVTVDFRLR